MLSQVLAPTCSCDSARLSFSSSIMICFMMFDCGDVFRFENSKHFYARSRPVTGLPAEFKHINKWRSKN